MLSTRWRSASTSALHLVPVRRSSAARSSSVGSRLRRSSACALRLRLPPLAARLRRSVGAPRGRLGRGRFVSSSSRSSGLMPSGSSSACQSRLLPIERRDVGLKFARDFLREELRALAVLRQLHLVRAQIRRAPIRPRSRSARCVDLQAADFALHLDQLDADLLHLLAGRRQASRRSARRARAASPLSRSSSADLLGPGLDLLLALHEQLVELVAGASPFRRGRGRALRPFGGARPVRAGPAPATRASRRDRCGSRRCRVSSSEIFSRWRGRRRSASASASLRLFPARLRLVAGALQRSAAPAPSGAGGSPTSSAARCALRCSACAAATRLGRGQHFGAALLQRLLRLGQPRGHAVDRGLLRHRAAFCLPRAPCRSRADRFRAGRCCWPTASSSVCPPETRPRRSTISPLRVATARKSKSGLAFPEFQKRHRGRPRCSRPPAARAPDAPARHRARPPWPAPARRGSSPAAAAGRGEARRSAGSPSRSARFASCARIRCAVANIR